LVVSWNKSSIAPFEDVMRMRAEPFFTRPIGLNAAITDGLFAGAVSAAYGIAEEDASRAVLAWVARAAQNPRSAGLPLPSAASIDASRYLATPLREGHCAPRTDGAVAMVLASGDWLARHPGVKARARLAGLGWSVDSYNLGGERLASLRSFRDSCTRAERMAGRSASELDVFELDCQTGYHACAYARALDGHDPASLSPSGGAFAQNPYFCAGLVNAAEAVLQLSGDAGPVQRPRPRWAAAHQSHGYAQQGNVVAIFEGA
ncbi:MAG: thiolase family protein, partial [Pseudomonadota bacterium]|nr:thiolase family protein [Pseudomonadota bacterium]